MTRWIVGCLGGALLLVAMSAPADETAAPQTDTTQRRHEVRLRIDTDGETLTIIDATGDTLCLQGSAPQDVLERLSHGQIGRIIGGNVPLPPGSPPSLSHTVHEEESIVIPIVGILATFTTPVVIVFLILAYKKRAKQQVHEERMAMIEKGIFDPALLVPPDTKAKKAPRAHRLMIWGIVLSMAGVGLDIMIAMDDGIQDVGVGIFVAFIGLGLMAASRYVRRNPPDGDSAVASSDATRYDDRPMP